MYENSHPCPTCGGMGIVPTAQDPALVADEAFYGGLEQRGQEMMAGDPMSDEDFAFYDGLAKQGDQMLAESTPNPQPMDSESFSILDDFTADTQADGQARQAQQGFDTLYGAAQDAGRSPEEEVDFAAQDEDPAAALDLAAQIDEQPFDPNKLSMFEAEDPGRTARIKQRQAMLRALGGL